MESFYPFLQEDTPSSNIAQPTTAARIAIYDDMTIAPRVISIEPSDIRTYLEEITQAVYKFANEQGTDWPFSLIRELVENYIHASFLEPTVTILDKGQTLIFSDSGPGIQNKEDALRPSFTSATKEMKQYIRGVGSGLPIVEGQMKLKHGSMVIEDNVGKGTVITVSLKQNSTPQTQSSQGIHQPADAVPQNNIPQQPGLYSGISTQTQQYSPDILYRYDPQQGFVPAPPQYQTPLPHLGVNEYSSAQYQTPQHPFYSQQQFYSQMQQPIQQQVPVQQPQKTIQDLGARPVILSKEQRDILRLFTQYEAIGPTELKNHLNISTPSGSRKLQELARLSYISKSGQKYVLTQDGTLVLHIIMNEG